jgi:hypothetical protein
MKIAAIVLAATLAISTAQCLLACTPAPRPSQASTPCHHRQQPAPQSCAHTVIIDVAPSPAKADLVQTGVVADTAARNVEPKAPEFTRRTLCREKSPPISLHLGLSAVLKI